MTFPFKVTAPKEGVPLATEWLDGEPRIGKGEDGVVLVASLPGLVGARENVSISATNWQREYELTDT